MSALTKMSGELTKLNPEDSLPSWWTNKVAVAVDKLDGMADYLDTKVEEVVVEANSLAQQAAIAISKKERGNRPKKEESDIDEAVKVGDNIKVRLRRKGREYIEKGEVIKIDGDKLTVKHDFSRTPSGVKMTDIVKEEVELDEKIEGLVTKAKKSGMPYGILKKVYDRGMAAYKTGHRPGTTAQQWAFARVNSFTTKSAGTWGKADADLAKQVRGESIEEVQVKEGTWHVAKSSKELAGLKKLMKKPIKFGKDGDDAVDAISPYIGDDELYDDLNDEGKRHPTDDARPLIKAAMKRLGIKEEVDLDEASARADAMRAMRKDKSIDPADVDTDASDDDVKSASKNIIMQLRKSVSLRGNFKVEFMDKKKVKVSAKIAQAVQNKHNSMKKATDKEKFQSKISKSYKDMLSALKENYGNKQESTILDRVGKKLREIKNG